MPIQLDKILENIAKEKVLYPKNNGASKKDIDEAWARVGFNNKLSVHESRSIFKVLQKKYEQEKQKGNSAWKLYGLMQQIHETVEQKPKIKEEEQTMDEVEEYEMLEVQEQEDDEEEALTGQSFANPIPANSIGSATDGESPIKSMQHSTGLPEADDKSFLKSNAAGGSGCTTRSTIVHEEKKVLNSLAHMTPRGTQSTTAATTVALQKKGITVKKTPNTAVVQSKGANPGHIATVHNKQLGQQQQQQRTTIQLTESLKRKLSEDLPTATMPGNKKQNITDKIKKERDTIQTSPPQSTPTGINIITIPGNVTRTDLPNGGTTLATTTAGTTSTIANMATTPTNGYSPRIEELSFNNEIIFDTASGFNGTVISTNSKSKGSGCNTNDIINFGNFDNSLPPTFFKNLCNSTRYEALGLYVSNVMNRLPPRAAAKLEISIVRALLDAQSEQLED